MIFDDPDTWTDEDYDLSELSPEEWPEWAQELLPQPETQEDTTW